MQCQHVRFEPCEPWGQRLVTFSFFCARCIRWPGFVLIRVTCRCVIDVMLLGWVCCTRLIRTLVTVCLRASICFCSSSTYPSCGRSSFIGVWSIKVYDVPICKVFPVGPGLYVEWPSLHRVWYRNAAWVQGCSQPLIASSSRVFFSFPWRWCLCGCESNLKETLFSYSGGCCWF